jgi:O-antigen/teichoic acid export membrane protein
MANNPLFAITLLISGAIILLGIVVIFFNPTSLDHISIGMFIVAVGIFVSLGAFHYLTEPKKPKIGLKAPKKRKRGKKR